jgi:hypothetical protein
MSYILFWIGDAISKPMLAFDWAWLYKFYNYLMLKSADIQHKTGKGPWKR